jgi:uncharacterized protein YjbI with pentapeptide repeats
MADKELLWQLKRGVDSWNQWRRKIGDLRPDLTEADLAGLDLRGINFSFANLEEANLRATSQKRILMQPTLKRQSLRGPISV